MVAAITYPLGWILALQDELHVVADADIDWKTLVIVFSSSVYLLETYLTSVFLDGLLPYECAAEPRPNLYSV